MAIYPLIDQMSCEVVLAYKRDDVVCAEVYKLHGKGFATHFNAQDLEPLYLKNLVRAVTPADLDNVRRAVALYEKSGCAAFTPVAIANPLPEWEEATRKQG
jgi:hypothetical protein